MFIKGKENELARLHNLIHELIHFRYERFTPPFLNCLKKELSIVINHANRPFIWNNIDIPVSIKQGCKEN